MLSSKFKLVRLFLLPGIIVVLSFLSPAHAKGDLDLLAKGGAGGWLNVERPLTRDDFKGRIVLLDFWTYGCINCIQIIPDLDYLEKKFGDRLLVIGVHSAKFKGEQDNQRILAAAQRFGLKHPVVNDHNYAIWQSYGVAAWPTQILLDEDGSEIARYEGEGNRDRIESDIAGALKLDAVKTATPVPLATPKDTGILNFPSKIERSTGGDNLYFVSDSGHNRILGFDDSGKIHVTIGSGKAGFADGPLDKASFRNPHGLASIGKRMIVADTGNHALREIDFEAGTVKTIAGTGKRGYDPRVHDRPALKADLASPWDVTFIENAQQTRFVVAMAGLHQLWIYDAQAGTIGVYAGSGGEDVTDGSLKEATLAQPSGVSVDGNGRIVFVDAESSALRRIEGDNVKTLIGTGLFKFGMQDGKYPDAMLQHPQGVLADHGSGRIYIADTYNNAIRIYDPQSEELSTLKLEGGSLKEPGDILIADRQALVVDTGNHAIKKIDLRDKSNKVEDWGKPSGHIENLKLHF